MLVRPLVLVLLGALLGAQGGAAEDGEEAAPAAADEAAADEDPEPAPPISARLSTRYRGRWGLDRDDQDLYLLLTVDGGDAERDGWTWHVQGQAAWDMDGVDSSGAFFSLQDTFAGRGTLRLYSAHADLHAAPGFETVRIGRQLVFDTPEVVYLDGVRVETEARGEHRARWGAYGGIPTYPYESSSDGDLVVGGFAEAWPARTLRARLDYLHLEDENLLGPNDDDLLAVSGSWRPHRRWSVDGAYSHLEGDPRDVRTAVRYVDPGADLAVQASYYELLRPQGNLSVPLDPFFATLFQLERYRLFGVLASKGLGDSVFARAGVDLRRLDDEATAGPANRDFERWFVNATLLDVLPDSYTLGATAEVWDGEGNRVETWGVDVTGEPVEGWSGSVGSYWSLFKYQLFLADELDHVRTWYADVRHQLDERTSLRLRYELEDNDLDVFHVLRLEATWIF